MDPELEAMRIIDEALRGLDGKTRRRVLAWVVSRHSHGHRSADGKPTNGAAKRPGRPRSTRTLRIIASVEQDNPATPLSVAQRTGIPHGTVKMQLKRLCDQGELRRVSRGLYAPTSNRTSNRTSN